MSDKRHYLDEIRELLKEFDKGIDTLEKDIAYIKGTLDEMKRHNGRVIVILSGIVTTLLGIIAWLVR